MRCVERSLCAFQPHSELQTVHFGIRETAYCTNTVTVFEQEHCVVNCKLRSMGDTEISLYSIKHRSNILTWLTSRTVEVLCVQILVLSCLLCYIEATEVGTGCFIVSLTMKYFIYVLNSKAYYTS